MTTQYTFVWSNFQPHLTIENNINAFAKFDNIIWNKMDNTFQVSRNNNISTFHSNKDLDNDKELGKLFLDAQKVKLIMDEIRKAFDDHLELFKKIKKVEVSELTNKELYYLLQEISNRWSWTISYFRPTQAAPLSYLTQDIQNECSNEEAAILLSPADLDIANQELIDWFNLVQRDYSERELLGHADKYPWIVACHFTLNDVIETLTQRYNNDKTNLNLPTIKKEKEDLKKKQEEIMNNKPELRRKVKLFHQLALSRMQIKSAWAGTDFYLIPIFNEISKRTNEDIYELCKYYLNNDLNNLLFHNQKVSKEEKENRKQCFVGLWKNGKIIYASGSEAEALAKEELKELYEIKPTQELKGTSANPGIVKGVARILESNNIVQNRQFRTTFNHGEILITQMTQPNIIDIAKKAAAIVTDEGGMLSHAAIISREFGIPCIVGTHYATKVFKDGDLVEVDADKGIVRKITSLT